MVRSGRRRAPIHRSSARSASISAACRPAAPRTGRGRAPSGVPSASARECAGSVETSRTRWRARAAPRAAAAAHVVLPTPPLPPKKRKVTLPAARVRVRVVVVALVAAERRFDARDPVLPGLQGGALGALADLPDALEQLALDLGELRVVDLAQLQAHLCREQLLAQHAVVVELRVHRLRELAEDELDAADEEGVEDDHAASVRPARAATTAASSPGCTGFGTCI